MTLPIGRRELLAALGSAPAWTVPVALSIRRLLLDQLTETAF